MTKEEEKIMGDHFANLKKYMDQDKLILAGPTLDDSGGYIILNVSSKKEARSFGFLGNYDRQLSSLSCFSNQVPAQEVTYLVT
jgi:uncharacterized protein YciI